jgi:hypothetical protein
MKRWIWNLAWLIAAIVILVVVSIVPASASGSGAEESLFPYRYVWGGYTQVPVYAAPGDPAQMVPVRYLFPPTTWMTVKDEVQVDQRVWYRVGEDEYVLASEVVLASPSNFQGVVVGQPHFPPFGFVVRNDLAVHTRPGTASDNPPLTTLPRYTVVDILRQETVNGEAWYQIGSDRYVYGAYVKVVTWTPRPDQVLPGEKWVAINLAEQTLAAYEGDRMVFATLVSTGLPWWQTPEGLFRIWAKVRVGKMTGGSVEGGNYYYLEDVPWTMYFYRNYGLHAAYWHDAFGYPRSRGCVNLSPSDARWLFDWASPSLSEGRQAALSREDDPGTWVYVHSMLPDFPRASPRWPSALYPADAPRRGGAGVAKGSLRTDLSADSPRND